MERIINIICLIVWISMLIIMICNVSVGNPVNPGVAICTALGCIIMHSKDLICK